jgi:DnaJ-class molecular chaperone
MSADPCPSCSGRGYDVLGPAHGYARRKCVVCNGTGQRPLTRHVAAIRDAGKLAGIKRALRRR